MSNRQENSQRYEVKLDFGDVYSAVNILVLRNTLLYQKGCLFGLTFQKYKCPDTEWIIKRNLVYLILVTMFNC